MIDFIKENLTWLDVDLVRNEVQHIVPAMDPETVPNRSGIKYFLDVDIPEFPMSSVFQTMIRLEGREKPAIQSAGALIYEGCSFRLESLLAGQMTITPPLRNNTKLSAVASLTTRYRLREMIEPALLDRYLPNRVAMRAGLAMRDFVAYHHTFFSRYQSEKKQFLTWQPNNKLVSSDQREYLYFLLNLDPHPETIDLRVQITRANGSRTVETKCTLSGLRQFQVVCAQVGPAVLALDPDVVKYEVWLSDGSDQRFTEVRTYYIDHSKRAFERFVLFSNSFGGFDTLRLLGKASQETDVTRSTSRKEREAGKGLDFSELEIITVEENSGIKLSTGLFESDATTYLDYLRELMLSEVILMETPFGFEAMNLITGNLEYSKDRPGLVERSFELSRTYSDKNYSRMPAAQQLPARATKWIGVSAAPVLDASGKRTGYLGYERLQKVYTDDESKVVPYALKPNMPGDPDYITPKLQPSIPVGSTPFPSVAISRLSTFKRNNCSVGSLGDAPMINIAAGSYGGERPGDADLLAEAKYNSTNTQAYANANGSCSLNNVPVHFGLFHKLAPSPGQYMPVVDLRANGVVAISNTTPMDPPSNRLSDTTYAPGIYELVIEVEYENTPFQPCRLRIPSKNREEVVRSNGFFIFENVQVNSTDEPLTIEVLPL